MPAKFAILSSLRIRSAPVDRSTQIGDDDGRALTGEFRCGCFAESVSTADDEVRRFSHADHLRRIAGRVRVGV